MCTKRFLSLIICLFINTSTLACVDIKKSDERLKCYDKKDEESALKRAEKIKEKEDVVFAEISGTITYQYNKYIGTKPDVNAEINLVLKESYRPVLLKKEDVSMWPSNYVHFMGSDYGTRVYAGYGAKADGYGNYRIGKVTPGSYYMIVISENTNVGYRSEDMDDLTKRCLKDSDYFFQESLKTLDGHKLYCKDVKIEKNDNLTLSYDFGNTYE